MSTTCACITRSLDHWTDRFEANLERLRQLAGDRRHRIWRAYLAGCAYAFKESWVALHQIVAVKARKRWDEYPLPLTRDYVYRRM